MFYVNEYNKWEVIDSAEEISGLITLIKSGSGKIVILPPMWKARVRLVAQTSQLFSVMDLLILSLETYVYL